MVLLFSLSNTYQGVSYEIDLKYGDGDISGGSSIFFRSKDERVGDGPLPSLSTNQNFLTHIQKILINKDKCLSVVDNRSLHSNELFIALIGSQALHDFHESSLIPQG